MNYDYSGFHSGCGGNHVVSGPAGKLFVYCPKCQVVADLEAIAAKIEPKEACKVGKERLVFGKQSPNVHKGAYVE